MEYSGQRSVCRGPLDGEIEDFRKEREREGKERTVLPLRIMGHAQNTTEFDSREEIGLVNVLIEREKGERKSMNTGGEYDKDETTEE